MRLNLARFRRYVAIILFSALYTACSTDENGTGPISDVTPPSAILDLTATASQDRKSIHLEWTAPGDDGSGGIASSYDLRYASAALTESSWSLATAAFSSLTPTLPGSSESVGIELAPGTWFFGIKTADEVPNWSPLSNVVEFVQVVTDSIAPARVADLRIESMTSRGVVLAWTAPGDDDTEGRADRYDLRYSETTVSDETWEDALRATDLPSPVGPGTRQVVSIGGLTPATSYFFALRTFDDSGNTSPTSNVLRATTVGFEPVRLTPDWPGLGAMSASWSPDGKNIAFSAHWDGAFDVYTIPSAGGATRNLSQKFEGGAHDPKWSRSGEQVSYISSLGGPVNELWLVGAFPRTTPRFWYRHPEEFNITAHSPSPDGSQIAYRIQVGFPPDFHHELFVVSASGGVPERLGTGKSYGSFSWSPEGDRLLFTDDGAIWIQPLDGGEATILRPEGRAISAAWSPDGSQVAFSSDASGSFDIWTISIDGTGEQRLTTSEFDEYDPAWSPDGTRLAFTTNSEGRFAIWLMELE